MLNNSDVATPSFTAIVIGRIFKDRDFEAVARELKGVSTKAVRPSRNTGDVTASGFNDDFNGAAIDETPIIGNTLPDQLK